MNDPKQHQPPLKEISPYYAWGIAGEIGYLIAIPAVLFGFGGAYMDKYYGTSPLFIVLGFILAACVSFIGVKNTIKKLIEMDKKIPVPKKAVEAGEQWRKEEEEALEHGEENW